MTQDLRAAAQLVDAIDELNENPGNKTFEPATFTIKAQAASPFWMEGLKRTGSWPWGNHPGHVVFRNVKKYGAVGDGVADDTDAINKAIVDSQSCHGACYGSTTMGAIIYFPPGTYLVSAAIEISYGMQIIGDANSPPTLKSTRTFFDDWVLSTDKYWGDGLLGEDGRDHEYYINTANFHRQIRNLIIDIRDTTRPKIMSALHYQVAQATSLYNVEFRCSTSSNTEQIAIYAENGSGGHMSDLTFNGGNIGICLKLTWVSTLGGGNQQFTAQRLKFNNVKTAVSMIWDWGWMWKSIEIENSRIGFNLSSGSGGGHVGSITIVDSAFKKVEVAILVADTNVTVDGRTSLSLDNVLFDGVTTWLREQDAKGSKDTKVSGSRKAVDSLTIGRAYSDTILEKESVREYKTVREKSLLSAVNPLGLPQNPYAERPKPQYEGFQASDFVHSKDSCKGDGVTDDTACLQRLLNNNANKNIVFIDAGTYILTDTLLVPPGSRIVGECWAQLAAYGSKFQDVKKPTPLIQIGRNNERGVYELQDLVFTSKGQTPGAVFVEWNGRGHAGEPGSAGMWDCHVRVGGALGTELTSKECPPSRSGTNPGCQGGSLMMHLTRRASAYLENVWLWVADHARGFLIESKEPTWLYGTSSEHSVFYQYQFYQAALVVAGMIQTEQPYYQPTPKPPEPFKNAVGIFNGDPTFPCTDTEPCDEGWALRVIESNDITILGAGLYSWFQTYTQECVEDTLPRAMIETATEARRPFVALMTSLTVSSPRADGLGGK
ncbi:pectate lyase superfamily protein-domain-containing protein [Immersiella caudata]|uniref:Pectate lyase superfamily protein-domain-containing protein n=1 Tax=Immersiella caudata TaxID=314043 RepID=A0AA39WYU5_9PEZI|nr:pectate lyase superfamily protein-domain-containing protein [Immersiella caudata]